MLKLKIYFFCKIMGKIASSKLIFFSKFKEKQLWRKQINKFLLKKEFIKFYSTGHWSEQKCPIHRGFLESARPQISCDHLNALRDNQLPADSHSAWKLHAFACMHTIEILVYT